MTTENNTGDRIPDDTIIVVPESVRCFYSTLDGNEIVGVLLHTDQLGDLAVLLTPDAARTVGAAVTDAAVHNIDRLRTEFHGGDR